MGEMPEPEHGPNPIQRAVGDRAFPASLFVPATESANSEQQRSMNAALATVQRHHAGNTLFGADGHVAKTVLRDLGTDGYWGLLVEPVFGGGGCKLRDFMPFITRMASLEPTLAGILAVHGCIGTTNHLQAFGTQAQQAEWLPRLARGERLAAFALTEPNAGSDLTAIRTCAVREGNELVISGEKFFITNAAPGRVISLVCLLDAAPAMVVIQLPEVANEQFQMLDYGIHALKHTVNRGFRLRAFRVPITNLLTVPKGNGLTLAYHGLNRGRIALCANAAGTMRILLAGLIPWVQFRSTYGVPLAERDLIRRRLARLAALIVGADALVAWCATVLDAGWRGEMECIVAKIFGSQALKEAAIELCMKTHGGRSFLRGHRFGDHLHDYLAPSIYEGEGEILSLAFFKTLLKEVSAKFPQPSPTETPSPPLPSLPVPLQALVDFARAELQNTAREISQALQKHQQQLADQQCRMVDISQRVQKLVTILATCHYAAQTTSEIIRHAANVLCQDLRRELTGERATDAYFQLTNELGARIAQGDFPLLEAAADELLLPYPPQA